MNDAPAKQQSHPHGSFKRFIHKLKKIRFGKLIDLSITTNVNTSVVTNVKTKDQKIEDPQQTALPERNEPKKLKS